MIIAYKNGKWSFKFGKWVYPKDYSRVGFGLDLDAKVFQFDKGMLFYRLRPKQTRMIDFGKAVFGAQIPVWEPTGQPVKYRFKEHVFELQQMTQYYYRPRQRPQYQSDGHVWWSILSVDDGPVASPTFSYQRADTALLAMDGYLRMVRLVKPESGHAELAKRARVVYLF